MTHHTDAERAEFPSPTLLTKLQTGTEGGAILCGDYAGGYDLLTEIWRVIVADEAARRAPAAPVPQDVEKLREELAEEIEATNNWRRLALQFDNHRMQAIWHLKAITSANTSEFSEFKDAEEFLQAPPIDGEAVLAQRIAELAAAPQPPEAEENPLQEQLDEALQSLEFYKRRCDLLQSIQTRMRDPERTMVCDVLANGHLLQGGDGQPNKARYATPEAAPVELPKPEYFLVNTVDSDGVSRVWFDTKPQSGATPVYTEQQVRDLLAAHGIGKESL